jgi:hypothetical protein
MSAGGTIMPVTTRVNMPIPARVRKARSLPVTFSTEVSCPVVVFIVILLINDAGLFTIAFPEIGNAGLTREISPELLNCSGHTVVGVKLIPR